MRPISQEMGFGKGQVVLGESSGFGLVWSSDDLQDDKRKLKAKRGKKKVFFDKFKWRCKDVINQVDDVES